MAAVRGAPAVRGQGKERTQAELQGLRAKFREEVVDQGSELQPSQAGAGKGLEKLPDQPL